MNNLVLVKLKYDQNAQIPRKTQFTKYSKNILDI